MKLPILYALQTFEKLSQVFTTGFKPQEHNISEVLTTDHHFEQAGFVRLLLL
ncbi:MAG TPA: hypothetical protein VJ044_06160 [Candidatus Hodarchaeales archaeon]|nr:hypothetical protein [Candidatus Hodarchaeales archaeon]